MARRPTEQQVAAAIDAAKTSVEMEGLQVTPAQEQLIATRLRGEITDAKFLRRARELAVHP